MERKEELVKEIKTLIKSDNILEVKKEIESLFKEYDSIFEKETAEKLAVFVSDGDKPEFFSMPKDDSDHAMEAFKSQYKEKLKNAIDSKKAAEKKHFDIKQLLLTELKHLVENEERISAAYDSFNAIKERWANVGNIPQNHVKEIQHEFRLLTEEFYYKIQIYKELQQNDLKKNFEQKQDVIARLKKLLKEDNIKELEVLMRALLVEWDSVGPTFKEKWEEIKTDFYGTYHELNDKIKTHYKQIREEQKENLNKKRALIEKVKTLLSEDLKTNKQWQSASNTIKELQEEWKKIGFVPAAYNQKVWNEFRSAGNELFAKKREFFGEVKEQQKEITKVKKDLIAKAEQVVASVKEEAKEDWASATKNIISLQRDWKNAGSAIRQEEQKLWSKFRKTCDEFFEVKDEQNKSQREAEEQNLKMKDEVIAELNAFKAGKNQDDSLKSIDELTSKYNVVGFIPFKQKEKQEKAFEKAVESAYKAAGVSKEQKEELLFNQRVEQLKSGKNSLKSLEYERISVRQDINKAKDEELQLANNLGFFSGSDTNPLIKKAKADHAVAVSKREGLESRMKQLNIEINAAKKAEEAENAEVIEEVGGGE